MSEAALQVAMDQSMVPSASETSSIISMIERAARDPNVDIDKMERLFLMHERVSARAAESAFNAAMARAQAALKPVARKLDNTQTKSKYADLAAISDAVDPIIHAHGFGIICSEFQSQVAGHLGIRCELTHAEGHSKAYDFNIPIDGAGLKGTTNKTATHAYGSTITYGRRYAKCSVFDIATKNDTDGNAPWPTGTISGEQAETLALLITETRSDIEKFLALGGVESLSDIPANQFEAARAKLLAKKNHMQKVARNG